MVSKLNLMLSEGVAILACHSNPSLGSFPPTKKTILYLNVKTRDKVNVNRSHCVRYYSMTTIILKGFLKVFI